MNQVLCPLLIIKYEYTLANIPNIELPKVDFQLVEPNQTITLL